MTAQPQRQDSTTNVVNLHAERARRRSRESQESLKRVSRESREDPPPTLADATFILLGIAAEAQDVLFLDAADVVAKLGPVFTAVVASFQTEARRRL